MIANTQTDLALANLYTTWLNRQSFIPSRRALAAATLGKAIGNVRDRALNLSEYRAALNGATCHWAIRGESCFLVVLIRFIDCPLPEGLRDLRLLEALGVITFCHLGISQVELVGDDWKGLRVMRHDGGWIAEVIDNG